MFGVILCSNHTFTGLTGKYYTELSNRRLQNNKYCNIFNLLSRTDYIDIAHCKLIALSGQVQQAISSKKLIAGSYNESFCKKISNLSTNLHFQHPTLVLF